MEKQQSVLDTINILYDSFFEQEKKVATYILMNHRQVVNMTINELAEASGTSIATISRFCRKCEVDGFHHLKVGLAREMASRELASAERSVSNTISMDNINQSLQNILANKVDEIRNTIELLDEDILKKCLEHIKNAGLVQLVAVGNTIPAALDGSFKFNSLGIKAVAGSIWETQLAFSLSLGPGDVMIAISNSGESKQVAKMVKAAKERGAVTIGLTNNPKSTVGKWVDYHIQTVTREKLFMNEFCFSRVSAMTVMEIFYLFLAHDDQHAYDRISETENLIADEKL